MIRCLLSSELVFIVFQHKRHRDTGTASVPLASGRGDKCPCTLSFTKELFALRAHCGRDARGPSNLKFLFAELVVVSI